MRFDLELCLKRVQRIVGDQRHVLLSVSALNTTARRTRVAVRTVCWICAACCITSPSFFHPNNKSLAYSPVSTASHRSLNKNKRPSFGHPLERRWLMFWQYKWTTTKTPTNAGLYFHLRDFSLASKLTIEEKRWEIYHLDFLKSTWRDQSYRPTVHLSSRNKDQTLISFDVLFELFFPNQCFFFLLWE